jgi:hypothetical protein
VCVCACVRVCERERGGGSIASIFRVEKSVSGEPAWAGCCRLKMEAIRSWEMSVNARSTQRHIREDDILMFTCPSIHIYKSVHSWLKFVVGKWVFFIVSCQKFLSRKPNATYRKYKEFAHMSLLDHPISQPNLDISPIWTPSSQKKWKNYNAAKCRLGGKFCVLVLVP